MSILLFFQEFENYSQDPEHYVFESLNKNSGVKSCQMAEVSVVADEDIFSFLNGSIYLFVVLLLCGCLYLFKFSLKYFKMIIFVLCGMSFPDKKQVYTSKSVIFVCL